MTIVIEMLVPIRLMAATRTSLITAIPKSPCVPIRVLMVIQSFVPAPGGTQRYVFELTRRLPSQDIFACIVTTNLWWAGPQSRMMLEPENTQQSDSSAGFPILRIKPRLVRGYPVFFGFECIGNLPSFDVVHIHGILGALPYYLPLFIVGRLFKKRFIVTVHMIVSAPGNLFNSFRNTLGLLLLNMCSKVTVGSPNDMVRVARLLRKRGKVELVLPGVDYQSEPTGVAHTSSDVSKRDFNLLTVGSLDVTKGVDIGIQAMALLNSYPSMRYLIVGPDVGQGAYLKKLSIELGLDDRVRFMGYVSDRKQLREYYEQADIVVIPSRYETTSMVALEAMALGKPVVATIVGGLPFVVRNEWNGILVRPSPQALANAIERLFKDETLRRDLALRARQSSKLFNWDNVTHKFATLYRESVADL